MQSIGQRVVHDTIGQSGRVVSHSDLSVASVARLSTGVAISVATPATPVGCKVATAVSCKVATAVGCNTVNSGYKMHHKLQHKAQHLKTPPYTCNSCNAMHNRCNLQACPCILCV